jgi:hypothetical protein
VQVALLTLIHDPRRGFDTAPLDALIAEREVRSFRDHFFHADGRPQLLCVVTFGDRQGVGGTPPPAAPPKEPSPPRRSGVRDEDTLTPEQEHLADRLKEWRRQKAKEDGIPAYRVLTNRQIVALALACPRSPEDVESVDGIGPATVRRHGEAIAEVLA